MIVFVSVWPGRRPLSSRSAVRRQAPRCLRASGMLARCRDGRQGSGLGTGPRGVAAPPLIPAQRLLVWTFHFQVTVRAWLALMPASAARPARPSTVRGKSRDSGSRELGRGSAPACSKGWFTSGAQPAPPVGQMVMAMRPPSAVTRARSRTPVRGSGRRLATTDGKDLSGKASASSAWRVQVPRQCRWSWQPYLDPRPRL